MNLSELGLLTEEELDVVSSKNENRCFGHEEDVKSAAAGAAGGVAGASAAAGGAAAANN